MDSQSVKTTDAAENRGIDGGKKVKGRKRQIVVDTMGNLLDVVVRKVMAQYPTITAFFSRCWISEKF
nr:transposase [uncultured Streptococcus sp.]